MTISPVSVGGSYLTSKTIYNSLTARFGAPNQSAPFNKGRFGYSFGAKIPGNPLKPISSPYTNAFSSAERVLEKNAIQRRVNLLEEGAGLDFSNYFAPIDLSRIPVDDESWLTKGFGLISKESGAYPVGDEKIYVGTSGEAEDGTYKFGGEKIYYAKFYGKEDAMGNLLGAGSHWEKTTGKDLANEIWDPASSGNMRVNEQYTNIGDAVNALASRYVTDQRSVINRYAGKEREDKLKALDNFYDEAIHTLANNADKTFRSVFSGERSVRQSVMAVYEEKKQEYQDFRLKNPNYSGLRGTGDQYLTEDARYMATLLRKACDGAAYGFQQPEDGENVKQLKTQGLYNENDLRAISDYFRLVQKNKRGDSELWGLSSEELGFSWGFTEMKTSLLAESYHVGENLLKELRSANAERFDAAIRQVDQGRVNRGFQPTVRQDVQDMKDRMQTLWHQKDGDVTNILLKSLRDLTSSYAGKQKNESKENADAKTKYVEYGLPSDFMAGLYQPFSQNQRNQSALQKIAKDWNEFASTFNSNKIAFQYQAFHVAG